MSESAQTTVEKEQAESPLLFQREGVPALKDLLPCSLQHVLACFAGAIAPAMMIASTCHFTEAQETAIIQVALILTALDTFLQQFPLFGRIGSNLPILTGVSFAFLPAFQAIGFEFGFGTLLGAELVGGAVAILFGVFFKNVRKLPPLVTGTVIFTIGVSLYPTAIKYMAGGVGSPIFGSFQSWFVGLVTFAIVFGLSNFGKGVIKLGAIFFGMIAGCLISIPLGMVDPSGVAKAAWFALPQFMPFKIEFNGAACLTIAVVYIMANVQLIGDLSAATLGSMDRLPEEKELSGALMAQGTVSIVSSLFGGMPTSAFGQNVGIIVSNKVINKFVFVFAAAIFAVAGFVPKLASVLTMIPQPVIGGATISVFGTSAITPCAVMAIILNNVLPPEEVPLPSDTNAPNDLRVEAAAVVDANASDVDTLEAVTRSDEEVGEVGVMFDAAERMATFEEKGKEGNGGEKDFSPAEPRDKN